MKKIVLVMSVMAMSLSSFADSGKRRGNRSGDNDIVDVVTNVIGAVARREQRRAERSRRAKKHAKEERRRQREEEIRAERRAEERRRERKRLAAERRRQERIAEQRRIEREERLAEERRRQRERNRGRLVSNVYSIPVVKSEVLKGESVVRIKKALRNQGVDLTNKAIKSVSLRAKSKHGRARVSLQVGRDNSYEEVIHGQRHLFHQRGSLQNIHLESPISVREQLDRGGVNGAVRLNIRGNVKLNLVEVEVVSKRKKRRHRRRF